MAWFYMQGSERKGPFEGAEWEALVTNMTVSADTWVWRAGMANWQRYAEVADATGGAGGVGGAATQAFCAHCSNMFSTDEMVQYGDSWVCAACKPAFFQKVKEGAALPNRMVFAGFWIRFAAVLIDGVLLWIVNTAISGVFGLTAAPTGTELGLAQAIAMLTGSLLNMAIAIGYETWMIGKFGATVGKMAIGLKVVRPDGSSVGYLRAFGRYWGKLLSSLILLIGYIMAAFDDEKRALHDRICDTRVVRSR